MQSDPSAATADHSSYRNRTSETSDTNPRSWLMVEPDARLANRYRIVRLLGQGATGAVYEAVDEQRSGLRVAIKLLVERHPHALYRLKNEFRALAETVHTNLVGLHGLGADALGWFVVMDLVEPSSDFLTYVRGGQGFPGFSCDFVRLRSALAQLVRGVSAIHAAGKVHRDLKPRNVLVTREGRVIIVDFGLVDDGGEGPAFEVGFAGTLAYAAPEQVQGLRCGPKADLYAVGVMLYEALTGRLPVAVPPSSIAVDVPPDLDELCARLLDPDPERRPEAGEVLASLDGSPAAPLEVRSGVRFVARERELERLHAALQETRRGEPVLVLIQGPSGIGKTALLTHFLDLARRETGALALMGRCHAQEQLPFKAFDPLVDVLGHHLIGLSALEAASLMPRDVALLSRVFPTLARVPAVLRMPHRRDAGWDDVMLRARAFSALKELFARIADRAPLVLGFDDMQWTDHDSAELLRELLRPPGAPAGLFLCVLRDGEESAAVLPGLLAISGVNAIELELAPLDAAASADLARAMLGAAGTERDVEVLVEEATGSPFLLEELSRHARGGAGGSGLGAAVAARVARLDAEAKLLLELVCSAGHPVELDAALAAAGAEPRALPALLASSLVSTRVRQGSEYLESHHDRIRETVEQGTEPERRRDLHRRLAEALEHRDPPESDLIAWHYRAAGLARPAARHARLAAEQARRALAFGRAAALYELAIADAEPGERPALEAALAEAYANVGRLAEAADLYERLSGDRRELAQQAMVLHLLVGNIDRGARLLDQECEALGIWPLSRRRWVATLMILLLLVRYLFGRRISALPVPTQARHRGNSRARLELCVRATRGFAHWSYAHGGYFSLECALLTRRHRDPDFWPLGIAWDAATRAILRGSSSEGDDMAMQRAIELAEARGDDELLALVLATEGTRCVYVARFPEAEQAFERAEQVLAGRGRSMAPVFNGARSGRLAVWICAGRMNEIAAHTEPWLTDARALGDRFGELVVELMGSQGSLALDDPAAARRAVAVLDTDFGRESPFNAEPGWRGEVALYEGNAAEALEAYQRARRVRGFYSAHRIPYGRSWLSLFLARACVMRAEDAGQGAARWIKIATREARRLEGLHFPAALGSAALVRASLAALRGDREHALSALERAADGFTASGVHLCAAAARDRIGRLRKGDEGARLVTEADLQAQALGVRNRERWFRSLLPGFSDE